MPRSSRRRPAAETILQARVYEPGTIELARSVDPGSDVVHAGTFFGDFLPALARSRNNGAIVWAFEPNSENYRCARITVMLNDLQNVELTHAALGANGGTALLATSNRAGEPSGGGSRIIKDPSAFDQRRSHEEVSLVTIDEVVGSDRRVGIIQLDVEGQEQAALAGAMRTIERCRPVIVLEDLPEGSWLAEHLAPLGYQVSGLVNGNKVVRCQ